MSTPDPSILSAMDGIERYARGQTVYYTFLTAQEIAERTVSDPAIYGALSGLTTFAGLTTDAGMAQTMQQDIQTAILGAFSSKRGQRH